MILLVQDESCVAPPPPPGQQYSSDTTTTTTIFFGKYIFGCEYLKCRYVYVCMYGLGLVGGLGCMYVCMVLGWWEAWHFAPIIICSQLQPSSQRLTQTKHQHNNSSRSRGLLTNYCATHLHPSLLQLHLALPYSNNWCSTLTGEKASHIDATYYCLFPQVKSEVVLNRVGNECVCSSLEEFQKCSFLPH